MPMIRPFRTLPMRVFSWLARAYTEYHADAQYKIRMASWVGVVGFAAFYYVWTALMPQPYESWAARAIGTGLCLLLALSPGLPVVRRFTLPLSYVTFVYCLPFFFTFMLLKNGATHEWQLSFLTAFVYMIFLIDDLNVLPAGFIGCALGVWAYVVTTPDAAFPPALMSSLPVLLFAVAGLVLLNHGTRTIVDAKMRAAHALAGYIAHEMRTPLSAIRFDAETLEQTLPKLLDERRPASEGSTRGIDMASRLPDAVTRILRQTDWANGVIDVLLVNVAGPKGTLETPNRCSMSGTIGRIVDHYPFKPGQRERVTFDVANDFNYWGSELLIGHVVFNLLRNALRATDEHPGTVTIAIRSAATGGHLVVSDSGRGVDKEALPYLFLPFRSFNRDSGGTGLGLAFCRLVVEQMGGSIRCQTREGSGTAFEIWLPAPPASAS